MLFRSLVVCIVPPAHYRLVPASEIRRFLSSESPLAAALAGADRTAGDIAAAAGPAVVAIDCAR